MEFKIDTTSSKKKMKQGESFPESTDVFISPLQSNSTRNTLNILSFTIKFC